MAGLLRRTCFPLARLSFARTVRAIRYNTTDAGDFSSSHCARGCSGFTVRHNVKPGLLVQDHASQGVCEQASLQSQRRCLSTPNSTPSRVGGDSIHTFSVLDNKGQNFDLSQLKGKLVLIVNVASQCGFTGQYDGLQALYDKYKNRGFEIIAFPCNQFGGQEPGTAEEINSFCSMKHNVTFPIMQKIDVNGKDAAPVYEYLKATSRGILGTEAIKWNFTKFLCDREGKTIKRYAPTDKPESIDSDIAEYLAKSPRTF